MLGMGDGMFGMFGQEGTEYLEWERNVRNVRIGEDGIFGMGTEYIC